MNRTFSTFIVAAPLALAVCAAFAQQTPPSGSQGTQGTQQGAPGNMGNPQTTPTYPNQPPPTNPTGNPAMSGTSSAGGTGMNGAATPFDSLDSSHQGYLTRGNAAADSWLASHFAQCDADRDGRVTRAEYTACSRAHP